MDLDWQFGILEWGIAMNQTLENTLENAIPLRYGLSAVNGRAYRVDTGVNGSERSTFLPVLTPDKTLAHLDLNPDAWMAFLQGCSFWWSAGRRAGLLERNLTMFFLDHFGIPGKNWPPPPGWGRTTSRRFSGTCAGRTKWKSQLDLRSLEPQMPRGVG